MVSNDATIESMGVKKSATTLKDCRHGRMLFLHRDKYIGKSLDTYGEFSQFEAELFSQILHHNEIAIEVGANIGAHTIHLANLVGPRGMVLAFEPQRVIFQLLCANVALNELFNVHTYLSAVGREAGSLKVPIVNYAAEDNFGGLSLANVAVGVDVPVIPLDSLSLPNLRLLKIDVEGMEIEVLSGARRLIVQHRPILYVENDRRQNSEQLIHVITDLGYGMWWHLPPLFNPNNYTNNNINVFGSIVSANLLCIPSETPMRVEGMRKVSGPTDYWRPG